jgi:hypothetical protein
VSQPALDRLARILRRGPVRSADTHPHAGRQQAIAVWVTEHVATMQCAYVFLGIGAGSLIGIVTGNVVLALACGAVSSYVLQLVLLPLIMIGQRVQQAASDAQRERYHEIEVENHAILAALHALQMEQTEILRRLDPSRVA